MEEKEDSAVTRFREYLRIKSVHPHPDYLGCIKWLRNQADEIGLEFNIVEFSETKDPKPKLEPEPKPEQNHKKYEVEEPNVSSSDSFAIWLTWKGQKPTMASILLNSHIDVVPVDPSKWTHDPFSAHKDRHGNIYARGSQDMKCVGVQYLEAIRNLKAQNFAPLRSVHVSFVPDEERGGFIGMNLFIKSKEFKNLNIGFGLDEGIANPGESFDLFYAERVVWQFKITAKGPTGHASLLHENTAGEKIEKVIKKMLDLRSKEKERMTLNSLDIGQVTSINLTQLSGGLQLNVVPPELSVVFDMRITPSWKLSDVEKVLEEICADAGAGAGIVTGTENDLINIEFIAKCGEAFVTQLNDTNPWWLSFKEATDSMDMTLNELIFPGGTDIRYLRELGIPALGFSPMNHTPILLHDHDEFLNENIFLKGITIYENIFKNIFNLQF